MIALTAAQRLIFAVVALVAVIVFVVWPTVRPARRDGQSRSSHHRLMQEVNRDRHR